MPERRPNPRASRRAALSLLRAALPAAVLAATLPPLAAQVAALDAGAFAAALSAGAPLALLAALGLWDVFWRVHRLRALPASHAEDSRRL